MKFTHLHVHSHYSLLDGLAKIDQLVKRAAELEMDSIALTDHGNLYGAIEFYQKAKKAGIKPIIGCEMYIAANRMQDKNPGIDDKRYHLTVLASNEEGYHNLINLVSKAHLEGFYYKPRVDKQLLSDYAGGLIALSGCFSGEIGRALQYKKPDVAERIIREYQEIFGKQNFYLEVQPHVAFENQRAINEGLFALAPRVNAKVVATNDIHYTRPDDAEAQDILVSVQTGSRVKDEDRLNMTGANLSLRAGIEMAELFPDNPEVIRNTQEIAERVNINIELGKSRLPRFTVPAGHDANSYLTQLCHRGLDYRYGAQAKENPAIKERLAYELNVINQTGFASYFLIVHDFIAWARMQNIVIGPGRGSAAGSLVSYVLRITNIDPLRYNLLFERFLNPERISMPDIDLDFADTRRDEVINYVADKYGHDHVAQIITFGTMAARAAIRDTGRALGMPYSFCDSVAKMIPFTPQGEKVGWLKKSLGAVKEFKDLYDRDEQARKLIDAAMKLEGVVRHASTHACGVVISPRPLQEYVPLQHAVRHGESKTDRQNQVVVTQYEMHAVEDLGLLKMDFLGLRNLSIIETALKNIQQTSGATIDIDTIPLDDKNVFELFQKGETTGLFQFECLSGDTFVSNTTIKQLYERRDKKVLASVYLDKGKIHKNPIVNVVKSGIKETCTLIAENGWYIRATKDHYFMTENGWKKLESIQPGERLLMKLKAKHMAYRLCQSCGLQINGHYRNKNIFCYQCSARFYSNPSKPISRVNMKSARKEFFQKGGQVWNMGVTTKNNEIWRATAKKISRALTGRSLEQRWGKEKADEIKSMLSERNRGKRNPMFGKPSPHRKGGFRNDLGFYVRSNWEADFARILNLHHVPFQYEPRQFELIRSSGETLHYTPDFYTPHDNTFYEIKGWMHDLDREKIELFQKQYPQYNFVLIHTVKFAELALQYRNLIAWECPVIPVERQFKFVAVKEINYYGPEETYDIAMEAPGNNFVANGFLVHNSSGMKRYLKELKPTELEDLIAMVSLYRPGPIELIPSYIKRKHKKERIEYLHPRLEPILKNTYGIGVYQEQMMQIARDLAGYTLPQADTLRKAIGKKIKSLLDEQQAKLTSGMIANGIDAKTATAIWELFPPFARYGFNRCLTGDTLVSDPQSGQQITLKNLYEKRAKIKDILSIESCLKLSHRPIADVVYNGSKKVWWLTTRSGRTIKATANHPFLTTSGWKHLDHLGIREKIAVPRLLPEPQKWISVERHKIAVLGYLLAEGNFCHPHGFYFYSIQEEEINDYLEYLTRFDNTTGTLNRSKSAVSVYAKRKKIKKPSEAVVWIKSLGLSYKKATEKFFPSFIFQLRNADLALLIAKMFQGDGCINLKRSDPQIFYATSSRILAQGLQHLLLRFEILSTIHTKRFKYRGGIKIGYTITISRYDNIKKFIAEFGPHLIGEKKKSAERILTTHPIINGTLSPWSARGSFDTIPATLVLKPLRQCIVNRAMSIAEFARENQISERLFGFDKKKIGYLRETVDLIAVKTQDRELLRVAESDIYWDEVKMITYAGIEDTYDLAIEETHNFVANDIIVHNSHAACYALVAYQTGYLKAHYPTEFMTALLAAESADIEKIAFFVEETRAMNIDVLPPDVNESFADFTVVDAKKIRFGLGAVKNVGANIVQAIIDERAANGRFASMSNFAERVQHKDFNKKSIESLVKCGALDAFGERGSLIGNIERILEYNRESQKQKNAGQVSLFSAISPSSPDSLRLRAISPAQESEKLHWEKELLGLYVTRHPIHSYREKFLKNNILPINQITSKMRNQTVSIGGIVASIQKITTKSGEPMLFVKLEDTTAKIEVLVFPKILAENPDLWKEENVLFVKGRISDKDGISKILCEKAANVLPPDIS